MAARIDAFRRGCVPAPLVRSGLWALRDAVWRRASVEARHGRPLAMRSATCGCPARVGRPGSCPHKKIMQGLLAVCKALARASKADEG